MRLSLRFGGLFFCTALLPACAADMPAHVPGRLLAALRSGTDIRIVESTLKWHAAVLRNHWPGIGVCILDVPEEASEAIRQSLERTGLFTYVERDWYART